MKKQFKFFIILLVFLMTISCLSGCAMFGSKVTDMKGNLIGNSYTIDFFDNFGNPSMTVSGDKINIEANVVEEKTYNHETGWSTTKTLSSVLTINIDGHELVTCGDSVVFYEDALKPDYNFVINKVESEAKDFLDNTFIAGPINKVRNMFGHPKVVVVKSQTGAPIYAFSGEEVYWEVPSNLPKMTCLFVDGHRLYVHRNNYQIIDVALLS